jgi:N-acetylglucosamine-6-phosphate deacetylase
MRLFDFQVNGFAGVDFQSHDLSVEELRAAVKGLEEHQTSGILLTLITDTGDALCRKLENIEALRSRDETLARVIKGYHLEGPWISTEPGYHGAHPVELACEPSIDSYKRLRDAAGGKLRLITLAPELDGSAAVMEAAREDGVRIGIGHSNAGEDAIDMAIRCGATLATHLGNAVPQLLDRHDNVIQRLLARDELIACLIPDGIHLPPYVLKNLYHAKRGKVFFTTDCMAAAASPPGSYRLGPLELEVGPDGVVHLPGDTRFAGSSLTMDKAVDHVNRWLGLPVGEAVKACSTVPADHFGIEL